MPTELDDELRPEARDLIDEFGKPVDFVTRTETEDLDTGGVSYGATTTAQIHSVIDDAPDWLQRGEILQIGQRGLLVADLALQAASITPAFGQRVDIDGVRYQVVRTKRFYTGELVGLWGLILGPSKGGA